MFGFNKKAQKKTFAQAVQTHDVARVQELIAANAAAAQKTQDDTLLFAAIEKGYADIAALLLDAGISCVDARNDRQETALMAAAAVPGKEDLVALFIAKGADLEARDAQGNTPLLVATLHKSTQAALQLIGAGSDVNAVNNRGDTPMQLATKGGNIKLSVELSARGGKAVAAKTAPAAAPKP